MSRWTQPVRLVLASLLKRTDTFSLNMIATNTIGSSSTATVGSSLSSFEGLFSLSRLSPKWRRPTQLTFRTSEEGTWYRSMRSRFNNMDSDTVLWSLIGANGAAFLLWRTRPDVAARHGVVSLDAVRNGRYWTLVTSAFSHADFAHLASNMISLYFFGRDFGRLFGGRRLLGLYLAGATAGSVAHLAWSWHKERGRHGPRYLQWGIRLPSSGALGASAAVNAIVVADVLMFPTRTILLYGIIPMPAALLGLLWLWNDIGGMIGGGMGSGIAHAGHLGGAGVGLAFYTAFRRGLIRPRGWW